MAGLERVVLASSNAGKLADFRRLFAGAGFELMSPAELGVTLTVNESGTTFAENARLKARAAYEATGLPALGDDSGLCVYALGGRPGVSSARYAGPGADDRANNAKLLAELEGVRDRRAAFVCVLALVLPGGEELVAEGRCEGTIAPAERGTNGFGYDPIFYCEELGATFGEIGPRNGGAFVAHVV
ncbi:MAG: RdgB/HAM1 family non-canonical purine NTP pyrophosphatase, partial [Candidatus Dadabacteria bacterium]